MRDLDLVTSEANRVNKLNVDNLALQVKNLELSRSLVKLEKFGTSAEAKPLSRCEGIKERRGSTCTGTQSKAVDKENDSQSVSMRSDTSEKTETGINPEENQCAKMKDGKRVIIKKLKKIEKTTVPKKEQLQNKNDALSLLQAVDSVNL